ncbi:phage protein [Aeromonas hydrophila]|nr:phage protein [Aeromonas hydrophila]
MSKAEIKSDAHRKAAERARHKALGIQRVEVKLSTRERERLDQLCRLRAAGDVPYTADEYLSTLIRRDWERWERQEADAGAQRCEHCREALPDGCKGAFYGEAACWLTKGRKELAL